MEKPDWQQDETFLARWLAGELSPEEQEAFEASTESDDFKAIREAAKALAAPEYDLDRALMDLQEKRTGQTAGRQIRLKPWMGWSVAASVALLLGFFLFIDNHTTIQARNAQQQIADLPDGSEVIINSGSSIRFKASDWEESRYLELEGEAFFKVKRGSDFQVKTREGMVQVLGTSFNVRSRDKLLEVICYTGKVAVITDRIDEELVPGMHLTIRNGEIMDLLVNSQDTVPSWVNGVIRLENTEFREVLAELKRTFNLEITYEETLAIDTVRYTGAFPNRNAEAALKLVLEPLKISYSFDPELRKLTILGQDE